MSRIPRWSQGRGCPPARGIDSDRWENDLRLPDAARGGAAQQCAGAHAGDWVGGLARRAIKFDIGRHRGFKSCRHCLIGAKADRSVTVGFFGWNQKHSTASDWLKLCPTLLGFILAFVITSFAPWSFQS